MVISEIKRRLKTEGKIDNIIRDYFLAFYNAEENQPGYDLIGDGEGISNLGNYNAQPLESLSDKEDNEAVIKDLQHYMLTNFYLRGVSMPQDPKLFNTILDKFFERTYSKNFYTFDNSYRFRIDENDELRKIADDIDELPNTLVKSNSKLIEKRDTFYKSHILSLNIAPHYRGQFVKKLFEQVDALNDSRIRANEHLKRNRPLLRIQVQLPKNPNVTLNERDSVTIMCNTLDLEDVFNLINNTFDTMGQSLYICRGEPNHLLANPYSSIGYDSYDTEFAKTTSELFGEIIVKAIDIMINKYKKKLPEFDQTNKTLYRQQCLDEILRRNKNNYFEFVRIVKRVMNQKGKSRWGENLSYYIDPNMLFVAPQLRKAINEIYGRRKYKVVSSKPFNRLDEERAKKI